MQLWPCRCCKSANTRPTPSGGRRCMRWPRWARGAWQSWRPLAAPWPRFCGLCSALVALLTRLHPRASSRQQWMMRTKLSPARRAPRLPSRRPAFCCCGPRPRPTLRCARVGASSRSSTTTRGRQCVFSPTRSEKTRSRRSAQPGTPSPCRAMMWPSCCAAHPLLHGSFGLRSGRRGRTGTPT